MLAFPIWFDNTPVRCLTESLTLPCFQLRDSRLTIHDGYFLLIRRCQLDFEKVDRDCFNKQYTGVTWKKGQSGNPAGRPIGANGARTVEYIDAGNRGCTPEEWEKIICRAKEDALDENPRIRHAARLFLSKVLMPTDPATFFQLFKPTLSLSQINAQIDEITTTRETAVQLLGLARAAQTLTTED